MTLDELIDSLQLVKLLNPAAGEATVQYDRWFRSAPVYDMGSVHVLDVGQIEDDFEGPGE